MDTNSKFYYLFILFYLFSFLFLTSYQEEQKYIEHEINIEDNNPCISLTIGGQENKNFYISLFMPLIITFEKDGGDFSEYRYDPNEGEFKSKNITKRVPFFNGKDIGFTIGEENLIINNNNQSISIGTTKEINPPQKIAGVYGLIRGFEGVEDLDTNYVYLNQLKNLNLISKKIFYIAPYYKNNELLQKSKIMIGKIPTEFDKKLKELPFCSFNESKSKNYYDCIISSITFEDTSNNDKDKKAYNIQKKIIGRFEEGNIQETHLPISFLEDFKKYFVEEKNCSFENNEINCSNQKDVLKNVNVSLIINNYKFILNNKSTWNSNGALFFKFTQDENMALLMSSFLGNY